MVTLTFIHLSFKSGGPPTRFQVLLGVPYLTQALLAFQIIIHCSCIPSDPNEKLRKKREKKKLIKRGHIFGEGRGFWVRKTIQTRQFCVDGALISFYERGNKDDPDRSRCKEPHTGMPNWALGKAARGSSYFPAKLFSKSWPFPALYPLQVMPEYLQCAICKSRLDMPYELYLIYYHGALPFSVMLQNYGLEQFLILYLFQGRKMFFFNHNIHAIPTAGSFPSI